MSPPNPGLGRRVGLFVRKLPLRPAGLESPRRTAGGPELPHRLVGVGAKRAAAVGDDLGVGRQLVEPLLELLERDRARPVDVPRLELLGRPDVNEYDIATAQAGGQLVGADHLDVIAEVFPGGALDFGQARGRDIA